ncbi:MAG TPA: hypothetical protein VK705_06485 [Ferruginibacter sp.]|jgi:hypothetical protein|nr:hypothetical protein [Ferruginibacter sp.]
MKQPIAVLLLISISFFSKAQNVNDYDGVKKKATKSFATDFLQISLIPSSKTADLQAKAADLKVKATDLKAIADSLALIATVDKAIAANLKAKADSTAKSAITANIVTANLKAKAFSIAKSKNKDLPIASLYNNLEKTTWDNKNKYSDEEFNANMNYLQSKTNTSTSTSAAFDASLTASSAVQTASAAETNATVAEADATAAASDANAATSSSSLISIFTNVLGDVVTLAADVIDSALAKKQREYTANYSNTTSFSLTNAQMNSLQSGYYELVLKRYGIKKINYNDTNFNITDADLESSYHFKINNILSDSSQVTLSLDSFLINGSKAKIKKNENLAISIDLKINFTSNTNGKKVQDSSKNTQNTTEQIVQIPITEVSKVTVNVNSANKIIPSAYFAFPNDNLGSANYMTVSASITEINLAHVNLSTINNILKNNSTDVVSIIKALFPSGVSSSSSSSSSSGK